MKNSELIGVWLATDFVFDNGVDRRCVIGSVRLMDRTIKKVRGYANEGELSEGVTFRFYGHNRTHPKYGEQFNFNSFVQDEPCDEDSVLAYLETCRKPERGSITKRVALALFEAFGLEAIDRLKADPVGVSQSIKQWDAAKAAIAAEYLRSQAGTQRCKLALITLLNGRGFPKKTIDRAIKEWGAAAAEVVRQDPYQLMTLPGIGFKGADKLYCDLARESATSDEQYQEALAAMKRQGLCAAYSVQCESRSSGSTWLPIGFAKSAVQRTVGGVRAEPDRAIDWAVCEGKLVVRDNHVAVARMAFHELEIAEFITSSALGFEWPNGDEICAFAPVDKPLSDHQRTAIWDALGTDRIACLQGSPGVGKTFCVAAIVKAVIACFGRDSIAVAAPTGKAAVRVGQSMAANDVDLPASTIHRLLQVEGEGGDGWSFHFNEQNPLPQRFLVIDECFVSGTMIDTDLGSIPIEDILPGQTIINAVGKDKVVAVSRKVATYVTKINVGKKAIYCSPSHRLFTKRGFVVASELKPGDSIIPTVEAMRLLRKGNQAKTQESCDGSFLQHALLNEMVDAVPGIQKQGVYSRACKKSRGWPNEVPELREPRSCRANREDSQFEPNEEPVFSGCVLEEASGNKTQAANSGRERKRADKAASCTHESDRGWMGYRVCGERMGENSRLSNMLQTGPCESEETDRNRDRRTLAQHNETKTEGPQENCVSISERVDRVETYESSHHELDQFRDADGLIYLYDLQSARHKSYSVEGFLVHNCSMIDTDLMASLLRACTPSTHVLFVGDIHQLAPVGHGRPFYDLQKCVPTGNLTEIRRNSGRIVKSCAEIRDRNSITFSPKIDLDSEVPENLILIQCSDEDQPRILEQLITKIDNQFMMPRGLSVIDDLQILTGKNDGSPVARKPLNVMLQQALNPDGDRIQGNPFRVNDKIVDLKNGQYPDAEDQNEEHFIANGELGKAKDIKPGRMVVEVADPKRLILICHAPVQENESGIDDSENTAKGAVGDWDLGFALSVHRSQGSQWPFVIVMADSKGAMVQTRNWLYTSISRAEIATFVIGQKQVVNQMLKRDGISGRKTFLVERIEQQRLAETVDYEALFAEV